MSSPRNYPASEVFVSGTFDDWAKSVKLEKKGEDLHEKLVELPRADEKIHYKFVVDTVWMTDPSAPQEHDGEYNVNNVLLPENITKAHSSFAHPSAAIMSGVTPQSTTAGLAGAVEKESSEGHGSSALPGMFPETPSNELQDFSVNPIPATSGIGNPVSLRPGQKVPDPSKITSNTLSSTVHDDMSLAKSPEDSQQTFGVAPIPASAGIGNPIHLQPGEKVPDPSTFNRNTVNSTVTTDQKSFESSSGVPQLPDVVTPQAERDARGGGMFSLPERSGNMIPESSLPMGDGGSSERDPGIHIESAGPQSTTAQLAANVPLEPRGVPEVVRESQAKAGFGPEASGNREAVKEKSEVEQELESKVPEQPSTAEGVSTGHGGTTDKKKLSGGEIAGMAAGGAVAGGAVVAGTNTMLTHHLPPSVQQAIDEMNRGTTSPSTVSSGVKETSHQHTGGAGMDKGLPIAPAVPEVVQESIAESHQAPGAAANEEMVEEKSAVEKELLHSVKRENASGEPAPTAGGSSTVAGGIHEASHHHPGATGMDKGVAIAPTVPDIVQGSIAKSHQAPEAAASEKMVGEKSAVEQELLHYVKREDTSGEPAPSASGTSIVAGGIHNKSLQHPGAAIAPTVPDVVQDSIVESHQAPEAAASREMVGEKSVVEQELLRNVKREDGSGEPAPSVSAALSETAPSTKTATTALSEDKGGLAAPASVPATTSAASNAFKQAVRPREDSRDVSPMSHGPTSSTQAQPMVTSGVGASTAPQFSQSTSGPATPPKTTAATKTSPMSSRTGESSASGNTDKKSKRASGFFGKLKAKFHDKDKK
ncbi:Immunoglobulin E-set [Lasallia pustulata]|uniref:Immunoglobulin E-set n=1 Tax=Lasallia pustulata TaxID=136370 RepID=A0A1W5DDH9_9LECA|nr:Immunoglobulin E-set [Lasallia pustulata]